MPPTLAEVQARARMGWQQLAFGGSIFLILWAVIAIPPLFTDPHVLWICNKGSCANLPPSEFVVGEVAVTAVFLGIAAWLFALAIRRKRDQGSPIRRTSGHRLE